MARVIFDGVTKRYAGGVEAVKNLTMEVHDREFLVLVGPSGCGKSTAMRMVAGLEEITEGRIIIGDRVVNDLPPKDRNVAMVFQSYALYPHMTVYDNLAYPLKLRKVPKQERDRRVREAARILDIEQFLDRKPKALSGGQRQRVALGRAIVRQADVFLMDEPLSNLDAKLRVQTRAELIKLHERVQTTTIYVTHDQVEAMSLADRIAVMNEGEIVQVSTPVEVYRDPAARFVGSFIGNPPMNFITATRLADGEWDVAGLRLPGPAAGERLEFAVRPEDVDVAPGGLRAVVRVVEPLGPHTLVTAEVGGRPFRAVLGTDVAVAPGDELSLVPKADRVRWFDPETGAAVR